MTTEEGATPAPSPADVNEDPLPHPNSFDAIPKTVAGPFEDRPELIFAVVRTLGSQAGPVIAALQSALTAARYTVHVIKISEFLKHEGKKWDERDRYDQLMDAGDEKRLEYTYPEVLTVRALIEMRRLRTDVKFKGQPRAFIIDKLVRPEEVDTLRQVCGKRLFVIGCDAPRSVRIANLKIRFEQAGMEEDQADQAATHAVNRDAGSVCPSRYKGFGVAVGKTLERSDLLVRSDNAARASELIQRLVECIMSNPLHTLTLDEFGMAVAFKAALTTASLARQVGAAIMVDEQIVAVGSNEVPKAGGGIYHHDSEIDGREKAEGKDPSDAKRAHLLSDLVRKLHYEGMLRYPPGRPVPRNRSLSDAHILAILNNPVIRESRVFDVIEYTRTAHAELVAITGAARLGIKVSDGTLYTTTLPCHECTRNIVAAGISRVVYLEPYEKSKGWELQSDSMALIARAGKEASKISFEPFSGINYRRFADLFSFLPRKEDDVRKMRGKDLMFDGEMISWNMSEAAVRPSIYHQRFGYFDLILQDIKEVMLIELIKSRRPKKSFKGSSSWI
ncbi:deaminase [Actinosynnema sp. NPDC051121]